MEELKKAHLTIIDNLDSELDRNIERKIFDLTINPSIFRQNAHV